MDLKSGLFVTGTDTYAKITLSAQQVDATWDNLKLAYPSAFTNSGTTISANGSNSYFTSLSGDLVIDSSVTSIGNYTFGYCTNLTSITFQGTKSQWNSITKGSSWNTGTGNYTIHCTDGDIAKS